MLNIFLRLLIIFLIIQTNLLFGFDTDEDNFIEENPDSLNSVVIQKESKLFSNIWAGHDLYTFSGREPKEKTKIRPIEFGLFATGMTGFMVTQHIVQSNTIWTDKSKFHFQEDGDYAMYSDKYGHFYGAYFGSYVYTYAFIESGFSHSSSVWLGTMLGLAYSTYIEIMDGFAEHWGFSPSDWYSNAAGASFYLLQHYVPFFQNFTPKFMYFPPEWHGENSRIPSDHFIDNYSAHTLWLSANIHNMLPEAWKGYWPSWLELSLGYAARNLCNSPNYDCDPTKTDDINSLVWGQKKYILALDYNLVKMFPDCGPFCNWFVQTLNFFKLPSPAIEFGKNSTRFMLLYPFGEIK